MRDERQIHSWQALLNHTDLSFAAAATMPFGGMGDELQLKQDAGEVRLFDQAVMKSKGNRFVVVACTNCKAKADQILCCCLSF